MGYFIISILTIILALVQSCQGDNGCAAIFCPPYSTCVIVNGTASCQCFLCDTAYNPICGSDGKTYPNLCLLQRAACMEKKDISFAYNGTCLTSCASVRCGYYSDCEVINGSATCVCDFGCVQNFAPVCGSDEQTYSNECMLMAESCRIKKAIAVAKEGTCDSLSCESILCIHDRTCKVIDGVAKCVCQTVCPKMYAPVCGSDGKTYSNECERKATSCMLQKTIFPVSKGKCGADKNSCDQISCGFNGLCYVKDGLPICSCPLCNATYSPVCGDDGKTYSTDCAVTVESCQQQRAISVAYRGKCGDPTPSHIASRVVVPATFASLAFVGVFIIGVLLYLKVYLSRKRTAKIHRFRTFAHEAKATDRVV